MRLKMLQSRNTSCEANFCSPNQSKAQEEDETGPLVNGYLFERTRRKKTRQLKRKSKSKRSERRSGNKHSHRRIFPIKTERMLLSSLLLLTISMGILVPQIDCQYLDEASKIDKLKVLPRSGAKETLAGGLRKEGK